MHARIDELVALRDGEGAAEVAAHVAACPTCAAELERLTTVATELRALPVEAPPRDLWREIEGRACTARRERRLIRAGWVAAGLAAAMTTVVAVRGVVETWHEAVLARETRALVAQSQHLEQELRSDRHNGAVVSVREASTEAEIEDRLAAVDARLTAKKNLGAPREETIDLWRERVELLHTLADVRAAQTSYVGL